MGWLVEKPGKARKISIMDQVALKETYKAAKAAWNRPRTSHVQPKSPGHNPGAVPQEQPRSPGAGAAQGGSEGGGRCGLNYFWDPWEGGGSPKFGKHPWLHAWQAGCLPKKWKLPKNHCKKRKTQKTKDAKTYKSITFLLIIAGSLFFLYLWDSHLFVQF